MRQQFVALSSTTLALSLYSTLRVAPSRQDASILSLMAILKGNGHISEPEHRAVRAVLLGPNGDTPRYPKANARLAHVESLLERAAVVVPMGGALPQAVATVAQDRLDGMFERPSP